MLEQLLLIFLTNELPQKKFGCKINSLSLPHMAELPFGILVIKSSQNHFKKTGWDSPIPTNQKSLIKYYMAKNCVHSHITRIRTNI